MKLFTVRVEVSPLNERNGGPARWFEGELDQQPTSGPNDSETQSSHILQRHCKVTPTQSLKASSCPPVG